MLLLLIGCFQVEEESWDNWKSRQETTNLPPVVSSVQIEPTGSVYFDDSLRCVAVAEDPEGTELSLDFVWKKGNEIVESTGSELDLEGQAVLPGQELTCVVTATDPEGATASDQAVVTIANRDPEIGAVAISPNESVYNDQSLDCTATVVDPEAESVETSVLWTKNGSQFATGDTVDLSGHDILPNQEISCVVTATDASGGSDTQETAITIANRSPEIASIVLSSQEPEADTEVSCTAQISDEDGTVVTPSYVWTITPVDEVTGTEVGYDSTLQLTPENAPVDATLQCAVTADDGLDETLDSREVSIQNTPPQIDSAAEISATGAITTNSSISCHAEGSDLNDGELGVSYLWNNVTTGTEIGSSQLLGLSATIVSAGDTVRCTARVEDAQGESDFSVAVVTVENGLPFFSQAAAITPSTAIFTGMELSCSAVGEDPDVGLLTPVYTWKSNGVTIGTGATLVLDAAVTDVADVISCQVDITDAAGETETSIATVTIENTVPVVDSVSFASAGPKVDSIVECVPEITDIDQESLTIDYSWELAGASVGSNSAFLQLTPEMASIGDSLHCTVEVTDEAGESDLGSVSDTIQNSDPTITQPTITPNVDVDTTSTLTCSAEGGDINEESSSLTLDFVWMNGETEIGTGSSITLSSSLALPSDTVECIATVTDSHGASVAATASVDVGNAAPVFTTVATISPDAPVYTGTELSCTAIAEDSEDGAIEASFVWMNGETELATGATYTILPAETDVGDEITCTATVEDSQGSVESSLSTPVEIENTAPVISDLIIRNLSDTEIYNDETVQCTADKTDIDDPAGDYLTASGEWSSADGSLGTEHLLDLSETDLMPGDLLTCTVQLTDGEGVMVTEQMSITIGNRPPEEPQVLIDWSLPEQHYYPWPNEVITCQASGLSDPDGETTLTASYEWTSDAGDSFSGADLPVGTASNNETWTCTVTVSDGSPVTPKTAEASASTLVRSCGLTHCDQGLGLGSNQVLNFVLIDELSVPSGAFSVSTNYFMMTTEMTQGMFFKLMDYESYLDKDTDTTEGQSFGVGNDYPAYYVNWHMAADAANKVTERHNEVHGTNLELCYECLDPGATDVYCEDSKDPYSCTGYRLPTEVEWEIASRSGAPSDIWTPDGGGSIFENTCFGTEVLNNGAADAEDFPLVGEYAWYCGNNDIGVNAYGSKEVAQLLPNGAGLYDMHGNISEWTADWAGCSYPEAFVDGYCATVNPKKVSRGGGWVTVPNMLANSNRKEFDPTNRTQGFGFRLVRTQ